MLEPITRARQPVKPRAHHAAATAASDSLAASASNSSQPHHFRPRQALSELWLVLVQSLSPYYGIPDRSGSSAAPSSPSTSIELLELWTGKSESPNINSFSSADLSIYSELWASNANSSSLDIPASRIIGPNNAASPSREANLDVQASLSLNPYPAATFELTTSYTEGYFSWAVSFQERDTLPQVVSISYSGAEVFFLPVSELPASSTVDGIPVYTYLDRVNTELMKIGLRGTSVLASSGDTGANGINTACQYPFDNVAGVYLLPGFPASSPYVTAVGATDFFGDDWQPLTTTTSPLCDGLTSSASTFASLGLLRGPVNRTWSLCATMACRATRGRPLHRATERQASRRAAASLHTSLHSPSSSRLSASTCPRQPACCRPPATSTVPAEHTQTFRCTAAPSSPSSWAGS